ILFEEVKFNLSTHIQNTRARILSTELPRILVNKSMFRQLLHNLIENSLKYRSAARPIIILRYTAEASTHSFSLEDNGLGIAPEHRVRIFDFAAQADNEKDGHGFGLSLCKKIVEMH